MSEKAKTSRFGSVEVLLLEAANCAIADYGRSPEADALVAQAREKLLSPELGTGGELIQLRKASMYLLNTLDCPDFIAADASAQRMHLAYDAGALAMGVDTADTIQAANSLEKMLAHQLAAAYVGAMRLIGQLTMFHEDSMAKHEGVNLRATRLAGAASRLMA